MFEQVSMTISLLPTLIIMHMLLCAGELSWHQRDLCRLQDTADQYLRDRNLPPVLQAVIGGKFAQQIICRGVPYRSEKEEDFYQVCLHGCGLYKIECV